MMGRKAAPMAPPSTFQQDDDGRDVPPSTISALVQHHSRTRTTDEAFAQILQEIRSDPAGNIPQDEEENCLLIRTLLQTCLAALENSNPLAAGNASIEHAIACLDVVEMTILRTPKVVFQPMSTATSEAGQLGLWMYPSLFAAVKISGDANLQKKICTVLTSSLVALQSNFRLAKYGEKVRKFYQICVEDLVAGIDAMKSPGTGRAEASVSIPTAEAREAITGVMRQPVVLEKNLQTQFQNPQDTVQTVLLLLQALTSETQSSRTKTIHAANAFGMWLVTILGQLWRNSRSMEILSLMNPSPIAALCFTRLLTALACSDETNLDPVLQPKIDHLLLSCAEEYLTHAHQVSDDNLQKAVSSYFAAVSKSIRRNHHSKQLARKRLSDLLETSLGNSELTELTRAMLLDISSAIGANQGNWGQQESLNGHSIADDSPRPLKCQKVDTPGNKASSSTLPQKLLNDLCSLLGNWARHDLSGLAAAVPGLFSDLSGEQQVTVLETLTKLPRAINIDQINTRELLASSADGENALVEPKYHTWGENYCRWFYEIITALLSMPAVQESRDQRIILLSAIKSLAQRTNVAEHLDLTSSVIGMWCNQCLHSSNRQLRLAAALALPEFLSHRAGPSVARRNRVGLLDRLRRLSANGDSKLCEALIVVFGKIACMCEEDERAIALNQLVEYLGHTNKSVCDMAYLELRHVVHLTGSSTPEALFRPFWKVIGVTVVKDILVRPQKVQQLSDLLGLSVNQFLNLTQVDVVPWLILEKKEDILKRVARALGKDTTVWEMCMHPRNMAGILSLIIVQHPKDIIASISSCLGHVGVEFSSSETADMLRGDAIGVACEILKIAGDKDGPDQDKAMDGFYQLTLHAEKREKPARAPATQARASALFFQNNALGIMNNFSDVIENQQDSITKKKRCLRALGQMIRAGMDNISVALPQIRASLQSAMKVKELRDAAFLAWSALIHVVKSDDDIESLIGQTFAAIIQNWDSFSLDVQKTAYDTVASLLKVHGTLIQDTTTMIPSLSSISLMSKFETQLARFRDKFDVGIRLDAFSKRCQDENTPVVLQAVRELVSYLSSNQKWLHEAAVGEQGNPTIPSLVRSLLDTCVRFKEDNDEILDLTAQCLGIIGCLDPNRLEIAQEKHEMVALSNFDQESEAVEFVTYILDEVLVKSFHSVNNPRSQGFLAYCMQELLKFCGFSEETTAPQHAYGSQAEERYLRWMQMSERTRDTLQPFLNSLYTLLAHPKPGPKQYPIFSTNVSHGTWLQAFAYDLSQRSTGDNAKQIFHTIGRVIRGQDIAIAATILPYAVVNVLLGGTSQESDDVVNEMLLILEQGINDVHLAQRDAIKLCSESVFQILDYVARFLHDKKKELATARNIATRTARPMSDVEENTFNSQITILEHVLSRIPPQVISRRAVECGSYARALFHWEQHMREMRERPAGAALGVDKQDDLYQRLQDIYSQIEEPDGIEGISTYLHVLKPEQQVLEHRRAGRWAAAQSWYELKLKEQPEDLELHIELLDCLKHAGQHQLILDHAINLRLDQRNSPKVLSLVAEAAWSTQSWPTLITSILSEADASLSEFNSGLGAALLALQQGQGNAFTSIVSQMRMVVAKTMSRSATATLQTCHIQMLKLHALYEVEAIAGVSEQQQRQPQMLAPLLDQRMGVLGSYNADKQFLLGIKRAVMKLSHHNFQDQDLAAAWLSTAKIARKDGQSNIAYDAVLKAAQLGDESAKIEQARLLWKDGEDRKAIRSLEGAIEANAFRARQENQVSTRASFAAVTGATTAGARENDQNVVVAKAHLLLAKWLDVAGQTQSSEINLRYQTASRAFTRWEKGLYYLGRFYNKLLESQKAMPTAKQDYKYLSGETAKLVIENYLRSMMFGCKYLFESMPKLLTLWLDFGHESGLKIPNDVPDDVRAKATQARPLMLDVMNKQVKKYSEKLPAYLFYTALAQMITRMGHKNEMLYEILASIIIKVVSTHPQQGLWPLLAVVKSTAGSRAGRATKILTKLMDKGRVAQGTGPNADLRNLVMNGQKLSSQLLHACEFKLDGRNSTVSLTRDMNFNLKVAPCALVVPLESTLTSSLPKTTMDHGMIRSHKGFPTAREAVTIASFLDEVLVLSSLQKPRKLTIRGSDGRKYGLLCKPNDDLRKDQRLMEFNAMINRALKKDTESSKRRLYIKTYAVTPLNEACGLIEWVDGLKPMRDILLGSYRAQGTKVDYNLLRELLNQACGAGPDTHKIFSQTIVPMYKPVLHEWFTEFFPDPESWFTARLRYTRSAAVASMQGYALGLGDRHGENVLLEESSGGVFHVDFNCLFEKGLTFDKPELVPFRLTHNMVDAFGAYGVEGPFRRSAECAMRVMRAHEDALLTILETFVYDPTADFVGARKRPVKGVPETPQEVLESVGNKIRGLMRGESVPLSVGGHVDALIRQATDPRNLCAMYIGWCAFL